MKHLVFAVTGLILLVVSSPLQAQYANKKIDSLQYLLRNEKQDSVKTRLLLNIGREYRYRVLRYDSALYYFQKALNLAQESKSLSKQMEAINLVAAQYNNTGRYAEALEMLLQNLKLEEQLYDTTYIFFTKREIMWVYRNIGDHQKEMELARELHAFANSGFFKDPKQVAFYNLIMYNNFGNIYIEFGQLDSALYYKQKMLTGAKQGGDLQTYVIAAHGLAEAYTKAGELDSALYYGRLGLANAVQAERHDFIKHAQKRLAHTFQKQGNLDSALYYSRLALQGYRNISDTSGMQEMALLLSDLFKTRRQIDSAYAYLSYHKDLESKSPEDEKIKEVRTLLFNQTIEQKQREQEQKQAQLQYTARVKLYSVVAGLIVLLLLVAILYRSNRHKQKAYALVQQQKQETERAYEQLKATQQQLIQKEKMASLGELTAGIAHEIQNPLNFVNNFSAVNSELVSELRQEARVGNIEEVISLADTIGENEAKISHHGKRADAIVKSMLQHSRGVTGDRQPTDINQLVEEHLRLAYHGYRAKDQSFSADVSTDYDPHVEKLDVVPQDIGRVLLNLFSNAFYAVQKKKAKLNGTFEPVVSVSTKKEGNNILITVRDNGTGMSTKIAEKVFQPFFTTKPTGEGTGLGLSLSYDIITKGHGGNLSVQSTEGEGSEFSVVLPVI